MKYLFRALLLGVLLTGCTRALRQDVWSLGSVHQVTLYGCDGKAIRTWKSTGKVSRTEGGGWFFQNAENNKLIEITGTVVSEQE